METEVGCPEIRQGWLVSILKNSSLHWNILMAYLLKQIKSKMLSRFSIMRLLQV